MARRSNHRYVGMCKSLDHADTGAPMKTEFSTNPELNAVNREKRIELQQPCRAHLLARCAMLLTMLMIGCGDDTESASTSDPVAVRPNPTKQLAHNSVHETPDRASVKPAPDSSSDSTNAPPSVPQDTVSLESETSGWKVLFRASDPNFWNTSSDDESKFSVTLDNFADEIRWLRMRRMDTREAAIIPLAREDLLKVKKLDDGIFWNGTGQRVTSAGKTHRKLGIASSALQARH